jgi:NADH dehydrogenase FAD-containing subunit
VPLFVCQRVGMEIRRVVIAGLGDSGVLTAIRLARSAEVVGISAKPALVSGQELGWRLSRPHEWARANWIPFDKFRGLDRVCTVHGTLTGVDLAARKVIVGHDDGSTSTHAYDALIIWESPTGSGAGRTSSRPTRLAPTFAPPTTGWPKRVR